MGAHQTEAAVGREGSEEKDEEMSQMCRRLIVHCGFVSKKVCGILNASFRFLNMLLICTN